MEESKYLEFGRSYMESQLKRTNGINNNHQKITTEPFITFSREPGAGSSVIVDKSYKFLEINDRPLHGNWYIFDKELIHQVLEDEGLHKDVINAMPDRKYSHIDEIIQELLGVRPSRLQLIQKTNEVIHRLAENGNVILLGGGSYIITRKMPGGLHVRLIGSREQRIKRYEFELNLDRKSAEKALDKEETNRIGYIKKVFGKNITDSLLYDLIINTDHISENDAAEIIGRQVIHIRNILAEREKTNISSQVY